MTQSHRVEVEKALTHIVKTLGGPEPIEGLTRHQLRAVGEYALEELALVQEVKRQRKPRAA